MNENLFENEHNDWEKEWVGMPEYNNVNTPPPLITATFKFRTREDFDTFNALMKEHVYKCNKVFDGMQREKAKQAWFPLNEKASKYIYES
jgi:hypothetical protein